jgi:hypothetical protein
MTDLTSNLPGSVQMSQSIEGNEERTVRLGLHFETRSTEMEVEPLEDERYL